MGVIDLYSEFEKYTKKEKLINCEENTTPLTFKSNRKLHKFTHKSEFRFLIRRGTISPRYFLKRFLEIRYLDTKDKELKEKTADYVLIVLPHDTERSSFKKVRENHEVNKKVALFFLNEEENSVEIYNKTNSKVFEKFKEFLKDKKKFEVKSTTLEIRPNQEVLDEITKLQKQIVNINEKIENKLLHPDVRKKQFIYTVGSVILAAIASLILVDLSNLLKEIMTTGFTSIVGITIFIDYMLIIIFFGSFGWLKDKYEITSYDIEGKIKGKNKPEILENFKFIKDEVLRLIEDSGKLNMNTDITFCGWFGSNGFKFKKALGRKPTNEEKQVYLDENLNVVKSITFQNKGLDVIIWIDIRNKKASISIAQNLITYEDSFNLEDIGKKFFVGYKRKG